MMKTRINFTRIFFLLLASLFLINLSSPAVLAMTQSDLNSILKGMPYYDGSDNGCDSNSNSTVSAGTGSPTGATFPNLDPSAMASAINTYISKNYSTSLLSGLGSTIVASAKQANVSPFIIVGIARQESGLANPGDYNTKNGNNPFGRTATPSQPHFNGSGSASSTLWYKWTTIKSSVDYTAVENTNAGGGGDEASYIRNRFASHLDKSDFVGFFEAYAPPAANDTAAYVAGVQALITELVNLTTGSGSQSPSGQTSATSSNTSSLNSICGVCGGGGSSATIVIDPGHSGTSNRVIDPTTGLIDYDYKNTPEISEVFTIAKNLQTKLTALGYKVVLTKENENDTVSLRQRADIANSSNAALAISIHDDHGPTFANFQQISDQEVGSYRTTPAGKNITFTNQQIADKSKVYATYIQQARQAASGIQPAIKLISFDNREGLSPGNIPLVQLFSNVPWVYNEVGANGITADQLKQYETGLLDGIVKSVPLTGGGSSICGGGIIQTALSLAWPESYDKDTNRASEHRDHPQTPTAAYAAALKKYNPAVYDENAPVGSGRWGDDCGIFVSTVVRASGADPNYPQSGTMNEERYVKDHPEKYTIIANITSTAQLQPGDILIVNVGTGAGGLGHTFIYLGKQSGGYDSAEASLGDHSGELSNAWLNFKGGIYFAARLKK